jgi:hypothetical protein
MNKYIITGLVTKTIEGFETPQEAKKEFINLIGDEDIGHDQDVMVFDENGEEIHE